jgi:hypothetical protein
MDDVVVGRSQLDTVVVPRVGAIVGHLIPRDVRIVGVVEVDSVFVVPPYPVRGDLIVVAAVLRGDAVIVVVDDAIGADEISLRLVVEEHAVLTVLGDEVSRDLVAPGIVDLDAFLVVPRDAVACDHATPAVVDLHSGIAVDDVEPADRDVSRIMNSNDVTTVASNRGHQIPGVEPFLGAVPAFGRHALYREIALVIDVHAAAARALYGDRRAIASLVHGSLQAVVSPGRRIDCHLARAVGRPTRFLSRCLRSQAEEEKNRSGERKG